MNLKQGKLFLLFLFALLHSATDTPAKTNLSPYASVSGGITYSGLNAYLNAGLSLQKHSLYIGPKVVISQSFFPGKTLWGFNAGYCYRVLEQKKWSTQVNVDYQNTGYKPATATERNHIHEMTAALLLNYNAGGKAKIFLGLGADIFIENFYNKYTLQRAKNSGIAPFIKFGVSFNFR